MRSFLLFLSLFTGCEASPELKGCDGGWVNFTWKYTETNGKYIDVFQSKRFIIKSTQKDTWENKERLSVYHDAKNKSLRLGIKQLQRSDAGEYRWESKPNQNSEVKLKVVADEGGCKKPFNQTAYRTAKTSITCDEGNKEDSRFKFFCKERGPICEDILSTKSALRSNGIFTLTETESGFTVSISNVSTQHAGVYWCGVESTEGSYRAALRKIQLEVRAAIKNFTRSPTIGQNMTYWCQYPEGAPVKKFICKGEDPSKCEHVVSTAQNTERFSMIDETEKRNLTITVRGVTKEDSGTYWCGAESKTETQSNSFFNRFLMSVVQPPTPTFPVSSTTTAFAESRDGPHVVITVIICVAALLLFMLMLILIYTRFSKNKRDEAAAHHDREDYIYEEIQECPLKPDSGNAINKINSTANFPTNPSASLHYSTINFRNGSGEAAEVLMTNPSSSECDYSAVKDGEIPTCSNVNQPSPADPLYSTVNKTQQQ
ncbi:uncharacterized protein [Pseudochaenichthys georgianus]|uniref:uncharacterized protein isoform X1 n=1 Tax=Pseudochaenichthys georgianus TaxID=52239 RepID=UPI00146C7695|nr:polymeric immunoglobulin receptor-like isoform X1 [Pseudochaenichthys georgianus]